MFKNKKVLVVGLAKSGITAVKALHKEGGIITLNDMKSEDALREILGSLSGLYANAILGKHPEDVSRYDYLVLSPGVPTDLPFVEQAKKASIPVIGELELGYRLAKGTFVAITGTNGKTTTTALVGELLKLAYEETFVVGNIGIPVVDKAYESTEKSVFVTEVSSFQLETIEQFKPHIAAILNVTPDHLNRHKTMENYIDSKSRVFENQTEDDYVVLNADNAITASIYDRMKSKNTLLFSRMQTLTHGAFVESDKIFVRLPHEEQSTEIMKVSEIFIPGAHNVENVLAAVLIARLMGLEASLIRKGVMDYKGVAHRIEFIGEHEEVLYYNDSKGTNPDSSIKAVASMVRPTVIIAGGMDKGSTFDEFIDSFTENIRHMIVLGETAELIMKTAYEHGYHHVTRVTNMEEAVKLASEIAQSGWSVLLSPACASWDMYASFEHRGQHFIDCFKALR